MSFPSDAIGRRLVGMFSRGTATIMDRSDPAAAPKTVNVVVVPQREGEDLGLEARDMLVQMSGSDLGSTKLSSSSRVTLGGVQYRFNAAPDVGIRDPSAAATGGAPIVRGILSPGAR